MNTWIIAIGAGLIGAIGAWLTRHILAGRQLVASEIRWHSRFKELENQCERELAILRSEVSRWREKVPKCEAQIAEQNYCIKEYKRKLLLIQSKVSDRDRIIEDLASETARIRKLECGIAERDKTVYGLQGGKQAAPVQRESRAPRIRSSALEKRRREKEVEK